MGHPVSVAVRKGTENHILIFDDPFHDLLESGMIGNANDIPDQEAKVLCDSFPTALDLAAKKRDLPGHEEPSEGGRGHRNQEDHGDDKLEGQADSETEKRSK